MSRQTRVFVYESGDGWRWRKVAGNGRRTGASEEAFSERSYCVKRARQENPGVPIYELRNGEIGDLISPD